MLSAYVALALLCALALVQAETPVELSDAQKQKFVEKHNEVRAATGADLPPMVWDSNLETIAQTWASGCVWAHSNYQFGVYGENLFQSGPINEDYDSLINQAVDVWAAEKSVYEATGSWDCFSSSPTCGHYSQLVWKSSTKIGCAIIHCDNPKNMIVCEYETAGNMRGRTPY